MHPVVSGWQSTSTCNSLPSHCAPSYAILLEIKMLALIARWTHNVLLTSIGLLTIALVVWAT
jgi:hypothetical protein